MEERPKCKDLMTADPVCCLPTDAVEKAARLMKREDVGPVPVVQSGDSRKVVGIITDRDIAVRVVAEGRDTSKTNVGDVMSKHLVTCSPDDDIRTAVDAMAEHQIRRVPVVDEDGRIQGIIAQADVATRLHSPSRTGEMVQRISE